MGKHQSASNLRPVIDLASASPGIIVRASTDKNCVFVSCVHAESNVVVSMVAAYSHLIRPAAEHALQVGQSIFLLAHGEAQRFFAWLHGDCDSAPGVH